MSINVQLQREEAVKRLEILKETGFIKYKPAIDCFKKNEDIGMFENQGMIKSVFYKIKLNTGDNDFYDSIYQEIKDFEKKYNSIVYLVLRTYTNFGEICAFLYVSDSPEEWEADYQDLKEGISIAYVYNLDEPAFSEFGSVSIGADPIGGGCYLK